MKGEKIGPKGFRDGRTTPVRERKPFGTEECLPTRLHAHVIDEHPRAALRTGAVGVDLEVQHQGTLTHVISAPAAAA